MWHEPEMIRTWMDAIVQGVTDGWVRPHVDKAYAFDQAGDAQRYMEERRNTGKVVLVP
jgi:synaptic vesicle membrane protein VAT-1